MDKHCGQSQSGAASSASASAQPVRWHRGDDARREVTSAAGGSSEGGAIVSVQLMSIDEMSNMDEQALMELSQRVNSCEDSAEVAYPRVGLKLF